MSTERLAPGVTVDQLLEELARRFNARGIAEPFSEAREIVAALYDAPRFWPLMNGGTSVDASTLARASVAAELRLQGAPLAYAVGRAAFRHLTLDVDERVLIPRPETEQLVDLVLEGTAATPGGVAIDVGTGSGAIALALAPRAGSPASTAPTSRSTRSRSRGETLTPWRDPCARRSSFCTARCSGRCSMFARARSCPIRRTLRWGRRRRCRRACAIGSRRWHCSAARTAWRRRRDSCAKPRTCLEPGGLFAVEVDVRRASLVAELVSASGAFTPCGSSWISRDASASCSPDDRRRVDDRGQGEGAGAADRAEQRVPGREARQRRAQRGQGHRLAAAEDGAASRRRAADDAARRTPDRRDGEAARRAAQARSRAERPISVCSSPRRISTRSWGARTTGSSKGSRRARRARSSRSGRPACRAAA